MRHKRLLLILICVICYTFVSGQNVSIEELMSLRKKELAQVEEFLTGKNWTYIEGEEADITTLGGAKFSFAKNDYDDKAESFITYMYSIDYEVKRIMIQTQENSKYTAYLNKIKSFGCKLISSKIEGNSIVKLYRGATTTFKIMVTTINGDDYSDATRTVYLIGIFTNEDYLEYFSD